MLQYKKDNDISYFSGLSFGEDQNRCSTFDMNLDDLISFHSSRTYNLSIFTILGSSKL